MLGEIADAPIAQLLGFQITDVEEGKIIIEFESGEQHHNPMGTLHGGVLGDLADAAMGYAFASTLADDELFTTVELKLNFLKPVWKSKLKAEGYLIKKGQTLGLLECRIYDEKNSIVAHSTSTCMIIKNNPDGKRIRR